jgi:hypothetical protein
MKFCTHCGTEVVDEAVVCIKCGCNVGRAVPKQSFEKNYSDVLLMVFVGVALVTFIFQRIVYSFFSEYSKIVLLFFILRNLSMFLPVIGIRNFVLKIIGIILIAIPVTYWSYSTATSLFR